MQSLHGFLCAVLSVSMAVVSTPGWSEVVAPAIDPPTRMTDHTQLQDDQRILHALNRFTFGPRPGDVEAVRTIGLDQWFEQQLHPAAIQDPDLLQELAQFPAMQESPQELTYRLPSNAVIRQVIAGKIGVPQSGLLRRIYLDQIARVEKRQSAKAKPRRRANTTYTMMQGQPSMAQDPMEMAPLAEPKGNMDPLIVSSVLSAPPRERLLKLAAMPQPELDAFFHSLKGPQRQALYADLTPDYREDIGALENPERVVVQELMAERLTRDIYAQAQLQEVVTDFWLNHFNIYLRKNETMPYYLVSYARDVIRPRALGNFEDLLEAVAHSPAMLLYLDNAQSVGPDSRAARRAESGAIRNRRRKVPPGLNENYGRELMELHTVGVNGGYTQADVIQAARILTGWTVDKPQRGGGFEFNENRHEPGSNKVMGKKFKDRGEREGEEFLHFLATRPATASFLSRELAKRFVSDNPPETLLDRMAKTYLKSKGNIADVLRTMYRSPEFWSQDLYRAKVKTPLEYVVSAVRANNADITNMQPLVGALRIMGMPLYGCIPPTGYKWDAADWVSTGELVDRMNFALALASNRLNGVKTEWMETGRSSADLLTEEARLEHALLGAPASTATRQAVLKQFAKAGAEAGRSEMVAMEPWRRPEQQDQLLAGLLIGSPEFQRR